VAGPVGLDGAPCEGRYKFFGLPYLSQYPRAPAAKPTDRPHDNAASAASGDSGKSAAFITTERLIVGLGFGRAEAELRCWQRVCMPEKRPITGDSQCVSYSLAQLSSQLRLALRAAFTTSKPPTLNRSLARRSNSLGEPIGMDLMSRADGNR
jgi:hypothetical protein